MPDLVPGDVEGLWREIAEYFEGDSGELPEVHFGVDNKELAPAMFRRMRELANRPVPGVYWDLERECDVPIDDDPNPAARVMEGRAAGVVACFEDIQYQAATIPFLALMVYQDELAIFWDVDSEWDRDSGAAFVALLDELRSLAGGGRLIEVPDEPMAVGRHFLAIVDAWTAAQPRLRRLLP